MSFTEKHGSYFSSVWQVSLWIGGIFAFYRWIIDLFAVARDGNILAFLLGFLLQSLIMGLTTMVSAATLFLVIVVVTILPYLVVRGLIKN